MIQMMYGQYYNSNRWISMDLFMVYIQKYDKHR